MVGEVYVRSVADIFDFVNVPMSTKTNQQHVRTFKKTRDNLKQKSRNCFNRLPWALDCIVIRTRPHGIKCIKKIDIVFGWLQLHDPWDLITNTGSIMRKKRQIVHDINDKKLPFQQWI